MPERFMKKTNVVIFGTGGLSSLAWYCLTHDSTYRVVAFAIDRAFIRAPIHEGLPVVAFEDLAIHYPPEDVRLLIAVGFWHINGLRRERYLAAKAQGYKFVRYISSRASTWPDLQVGENCLIYEHAIIQPFASIGDNTTIRSGAHISHHCQVAQHVFVAAGVTLGGNVKIGDQCFIGLGAVLRDGLIVAPRSFIGAGAVVVANTEPDGVYVGSPARKMTRTSLEVT